MNPPDSRVTVSEPEKQPLTDDEVLPVPVPVLSTPDGNWIEDVGLALGLDVGAPGMTVTVLLGEGVAALPGDIVVETELAPGIVIETSIVAYRACWRSDVSHKPVHSAETVIFFIRICDDVLP